MATHRQYTASLDRRFADIARSRDSLNAHVDASLRRARKLETQRNCMRRLRASRKAQ